MAQAIRAAVLEGLAAGAWGVVHEMGLAQRCWGFNMEDIKVKHVFMWHGLQVCKDWMHQDLIAGMPQKSSKYPLQAQ